MIDRQIIKQIDIDRYRWIDKKKIDNQMYINRKIEKQKDDRQIDKQIQNT